MTQKDGVYFADRDYSVLLHPPESYPDGICYHHYVDIVAGPFHGTIDATSFVKVQALDQFRKELVALYENLTGEAHLKNVYENFKLELRGDGRGHVVVHVDAVAGPSMDTRLTFNFTIDQTQLPPAITSLSKFRSS